MNARGIRKANTIRKLVASHFGINPDRVDVKREKRIDPIRYVWTASVDGRNYNSLADKMPNVRKRIAKLDRDLF